MKEIKYSGDFSSDIDKLSVDYKREEMSIHFLSQIVSVLISFSFLVLSITFANLPGSQLMSSMIHFFSFCIPLSLYRTFRTYRKIKRERNEAALHIKELSRNLRKNNVFISKNDLVNSDVKEDECLMKRVNSEMSDSESETSGMKKICEYYFLLDRYEQLQVLQHMKIWAIEEEKQKLLEDKLFLLEEKEKDDAILSSFKRELKKNK